MGSGIRPPMKTQSVPGSHVAGAGEGGAAPNTLHHDGQPTHRTQIQQRPTGCTEGLEHAVGTGKASSTAALATVGSHVVHAGSRSNRGGGSASKLAPSSSGQGTD